MLSAGRGLSRLVTRSVVGGCLSAPHPAVRSRSSMSEGMEQRMVWVDLEMTGLDIKKDQIIEMACLITDSDLNILAEGPNLIIKQPDELLDTMSNWCKEHHGKSGLTQAVRNSKISLAHAEYEFLSFIRKHTPPGFCPLAGAVKGSKLIDIGTAPSIYQLLSACEIFDDITVTWHTKRELQELQKWLNNEPDAFDWSSIVTHVCEIEGNRMGKKEKEEKLRGKIKQVLMCDVSKNNPLAPHEVPGADCLITTVCLEAACRSYESYGTALKNLSHLLKPKGTLLMAGDLGANYYEVGSNKVFSLPVNEKFLKKAISESGYEIIQLVSFGKPEDAEFDNSDYEGFYFVHAQKI